MNAIKAFYSFSGRIGRRGFIAGIAAIFFLASMATVGTTPDILSKDPFGALVDNWKNMGLKDVIIYLVMLYPAMALVTQRLHDRNKSGLVAALFWAPALVSAIGVLFPGSTSIIGYMTTGVSWLTAWIGGVGTWFLIELGFFGPKEPNKYGPDPRDD